MITITSVSKETLTQLISSDFLSTLSVEGQEIMVRTLNNSTLFWIAENDGELLGFWGLLPESLLGTKAYIWLYTVADLSSLRRSFGRKSIEALRRLLAEYPTIVGHCARNNPGSIRWLKWLGATFGETQGEFVTFTLGT